MTFGPLGDYITTSSNGDSLAVALKADRKFPVPFPVDCFQHVPYAGGGDSLPVLDRVPLSASHYTQIDKTMNAQIWGVLPTPMQIVCDKAKFKDKFLHEISPACDVLCHRSAKGVLDRRHIPLGMSKYERGRIACNLGILFVIGIRLEMDGYLRVNSLFAAPAWNDFVARANVRQLDPLPQVVALAMAMKLEGNKLYKEAKYGQAMVQYHNAALALYPWVSTPLLFTSNAAFEYGVAQLESTLWCNMSATALQLATLHPVSRGLWINTAYNCGEAAFHFRFITHNMLAKAYWRAYQARMALHEVGPLIDFPVSPPVRDDMYQRAQEYLLISNYVALADPGDGSWAHRDCHDRHDGCTSIAKAQQKLDNMSPAGGTVALPSGKSLKFTFDK